MGRLLLMVGAFILIAGTTIYMMPPPDPAAAEAAALERAAQRNDAEQVRLAEVAASGMTPLDKALAHAAALDPINRSQAEGELSNAVTASIEANRLARENYPQTDADIAHFQRVYEPQRRAARRQWEGAMQRLYGPTWSAYHEAQGRQLAQAGGRRLGYPVD